MKRSPLRRRVSLRESFLKKLKREGTKILFKRGGRIERRKPLKKLSRSHRHKLQQYYALRNEFLSQPENRLCEICRRRRESGEDIRQNESTEVHHFAGRIGRLLCYVPFFRSSCHDCREWPHQNQVKAREMGLLAPAHLWNVFPGNGNHH